MLSEFLLATQLNNNFIAEYNMEGFLPTLRNEKTIYPSGLEYKDESHVKYGPPSSTDPVLFIVDPIFDRRMNYIAPGYYQLSLSSDRKYMYLIQTGKVLAIIPVFKVEIDKKKDEQKLKNQPPKGFIKYQKYKFKKKREEKKRQTAIKKKKIEPETKIYNEASIELDSSKKYYLIMYEKDSIRAWGALKFR